MSPKPSHVGHTSADVMEWEESSGATGVPLRDTQYWRGHNPMLLNPRELDSRHVFVRQ